MLIDDSSEGTGGVLRPAVRRVLFRLPASCGARCARLVGSFDGWTEGFPMRRLADGSFEAAVSLPEGERVEFRYLLDGSVWQNDPEAHDYVPNQFGGYNSVLYPSTGPG